MIANTLQDETGYDLCVEEREALCNVVAQAFEDLKKPLSDEDCSYRWWTDPVNDMRDFALESTGISLAAVKRKHADLFAAREKEAEAVAKKAEERWAKARKKVEEDRRKAEERERAKAEQSARMRREYEASQRRMAQKAEIKRKMEEMKAALKALD